MDKTLSIVARIIVLTALLKAPETLAQSWIKLGNGMSSLVTALASDTNDNLYAGGQFTNAGGVAANYVAKWNGTSWTNLSSGMNSWVATLVFDTNGNLYAGGYFTNAGGVTANRVAKWNGTSWTNLGSGVSSHVITLVFDTNGNLYAGGYFTNAGGVTANRVAKWNGTFWTNLGSGMNSWIEALSLDSNGNLYAGGYFTNAGGVVASNIAKWNGTSWTNLSIGMNNWVTSLAFDTNSNLYAGGNFTSAGGEAVNYIAKWNGATWTNLGSGMNSTVNALTLDTNGNLYAGGGFTNTGEVAASRIAKWNGTSWTNLSSGVNNDIWELVFDIYGNLYAGGSFSAAGGISAGGIAKWGYPTNITIIGTNGELIASGEAANVNKGTDFGTFSLLGMVITNVYVITNSGPGALLISAWTTNGIGAAQFTVRNVPARVSQGVASNFTISFNPSAAGVLTASVLIANSSAQAQYVLNLRGTVEKWTQTITFPAIATQNVTNSLTLSATASSGLPVSFSVGSGPATINNNITTFSASGQVSIVASQSGNANWNAAPEVTNVFTVVSVPTNIPTGVKASYGTYQDKVRISWIASIGAWGYQVWRGTNSESGLAGQIGQTAATSFNDTEAVPNVLYYYWVRATNDVGASAFGGPDIGFRAPSSSSLDAPSGVAASDGTYTNKVRVSWNAVSGALSYELWRNMSNNSASASLIAQITNSATYDNATVTPGANYCYWVKAKNAQTTSAFSNPDSGYAALSAVSGYADLEVSDVILLPTTQEVGGHPGAAGLQLLNWGPNDLTAPGTRVILDFFLSQNATFGDTNDLWLGDFQTDVALAVGDHTLVAVTASARDGFTVPSGALGTNYVFARARHTYPSTLGDSDESNNHALRSGTINVVAADVPIAGYHVFNDYDGDGKSDLALYRETTGEWSILLSGSGYQTASVVLGGPSYQPALADYDGDGKNDLAVYHQASGEWTFLLSASSYASAALEMGGSGYTPVAADYDGDGKADPTVYQESSGLWQILKSASSYAPFNTSLGGNGYKAVAADFDGDGQSDIAVYRRSTGDWRIMLSSLEYWTTEFQFGGSGQVPVPADYDADGKTDAAVYKDSSGEWRVMLSKFSYLTATATFGGKGYVAVPADYDGDGKGDVVVYNENTAELKILLSGSGYSLVTVNIGGPGYEPVGYYDW